MAPSFLCYTLTRRYKHMPARNRKFTFDIVPVGDHLEVTIPEIGVTVATAGTTRREAIDAAHRAIIEHLMQQRRQTRKTRRPPSPHHHAPPTYPPRPSS